RWPCPCAATVALRNRCCPAAGPPRNGCGRRRGPIRSRCRRQAVRWKRSGRWRGRRGKACWSCGGSLQARQEGGDIGDVLRGEALRLRLHGRVLAVARLVLGQRVDQVRLGLPPELGYVVVRVGVLVALDAVAPLAGVDQQPAALGVAAGRGGGGRSEEHTSELQSRENLVCRLLLEKKNKNNTECV